MNIEKIVKRMQGRYVSGSLLPDILTPTYVPTNNGGGGGNGRYGCKIQSANNYDETAEFTDNTLCTYDPVGNDYYRELESVLPRNMNAVNRKFIPNKYAEIKAFNDFGSTPYNGTWYQRHNQLGAESLYNTRNTTDIRHYYTLKSGTNALMQRSTIGGTLGSTIKRGGGVPGQGALIFDLKDADLTNVDTGANTGGSANVDSTDPFYIQAPVYGSMLFDPTFRRSPTNPKRPYSLKFAHNSFDPDVKAPDSEGIYIPYNMVGVVDATSTTAKPAEKAIRAEIGCNDVLNVGTADGARTVVANNRRELWGFSVYFNDKGRPTTSTLPTFNGFPSAAQNSEWITGSLEKQASAGTLTCHFWQAHGWDSLNPCLGLGISEGELEFQIKWSNTNPTTVTPPNYVLPTSAPSTGTGADWQGCYNMGAMNYGFAGTGTHKTRGYINETTGTTLSIDTRLGNNLLGAASIGSPMSPPVGQWVDFVIDINWDTRPAYKRVLQSDGTYKTVEGVFGTDYDGRTKVYVAYRPYSADGKNQNTDRILRLWVDHKGPNCYNNDLRAPYIKMGQYYRYRLARPQNSAASIGNVWSWTRTSWFDEIYQVRDVYSGSTKTYTATMEDAMPGRPT